MIPQDLSQYSDTRFRRLTGVRRSVFRLMLTTIASYESEFRAVSGRKSVISLENQLLITLFYWKHYSSLLLLAHFFEVHESTICRIIQKIEQILRDSGQFDLPEHQLTETGVCLVDATEIQIQRPEKHQEESYSGKKKSTVLSFK